PVLAIDARDVTKTFKSGWLRPTRTAALRGVSLTVPRGAIVGLLGPNGAGKTTLLSILATLLTPDSGSVTVLGHDVARDAARLRRRLNMASGRPSFLWSLRVGEIIGFYGRLYGLSGRQLRRRVDELIELCELSAHRRTPYSELSTGLKQRVALAESPGVLRCAEVAGWIECTVDDAEKRLPDLLRALHAEGVVVRNIRVREPELEEVFVELAR